MENESVIRFFERVKTRFEGAGARNWQERDTSNRGRAASWHDPNSDATYVLSIKSSGQDSFDWDLAIDTNEVSARETGNRLDADDVVRAQEKLRGELLKVRGSEPESNVDGLSSDSSREVALQMMASKEMKDIVEELEKDGAKVTVAFNVKMARGKVCNVLDWVTVGGRTFTLALNKDSWYIYTEESWSPNKTAELTSVDFWREYNKLRKRTDDLI